MSLHYISFFKNLKNISSTIIVYKSKAQVIRSVEKGYLSTPVNDRSKQLFVKEKVEPHDL